MSQINIMESLIFIAIGCGITCTDVQVSGRIIYILNMQHAYQCLMLKGT